MKIYFKQIARLVCMLVFLSILFSIGRFILYFTNNQLFQEFPLADILLTIAKGLEYDFYAVVYINALFIFLFLLPVNIYNSIFYQFVLRLVFLIVNSFAIFINLIDSKVYFHTNHRLRAFDAKQDIIELIKNLKSTDIQIFIDEYLSLLICFIAFFFMIILIMRFIKIRNIENKKEKTSLKLSSLFLAVLISFAFYIFIIANQDISLKRFYLKSDRKLVPILVNTPYFLMSSYFHDEQKIASDNEWNIEKYKPKKEYSNVAKPFSNIKLVILDNPNENNSIKNGIYLINNSYSNIYQFLDEILFSYPSLFRKGLYSSFYSFNNIESLIDIVKSIGYYTKLSTFGYDKETAQLIRNFYRFDNYSFKDSSKVFEMIMLKDKQQYDSLKSTLANSIKEDGKVVIFCNIYEGAFGDSGNSVLQQSFNILSKDLPRFYMAKDSLITQYLDLKPSILQLIGYSKPFIAYGQSIFSQGEKAGLQIVSESSACIVSDSLLLHYSNNATISLHKIKKYKLTDYDYKDSLAVERVILENKLQSMLLDFGDRILTNKLSIDGAL